jgi:hypothetical protein
MSAGSCHDGKSRQRLKEESLKDCQLRQKKNGILIVGIVLANIVTAFCVLRAAQMETPYWRVEPGLAMRYSIIVKGYTMHILGSNITYGPPPFKALNVSLIDLYVARLPALDDTIDNRTFALRIIDYLKTQQVGTLRYLNGTLFANSGSGMLNIVISQCILPVGAWNLLDSFYPSEPLGGSVCQAYFSEMRNDQFLIGYVTSTGESGNGWFGEVDIDTGVPSTVTSWAVQMNETYSYSYSIVLTISY